MKYVKKYIKITFVGSENCGKSFLIENFFDPQLSLEQFKSNGNSLEANLYQIRKTKLQYDDIHYILYFQDTLDALSVNKQVFPEISKDTDFFVIFLEIDFKQQKQIDQFRANLEYINKVSSNSRILFVGNTTKKESKEGAKLVKEFTSLNVITYLEIDYSSTSISKIIQYVLKYYSSNLKDFPTRIEICSHEVTSFQRRILSLPINPVKDLVLDKRYVTEYDKIIIEMIHSEYQYIYSITFIIHFYKKAFENRFGATNQQLNSIFSNIEEVERLSRHILKNLLIEYAKPRHTQNFANTFLRLKQNILDVYKPICVHSKYSASSLEQFRLLNPTVEQYISKVAKITPRVVEFELDFDFQLQNIPFMPINRIEYYQSTLSQLMVVVPEWELVCNEAMSMFHSILSNLENETSRIAQQIAVVQSIRQQFLYNEPETLNNSTSHIYLMKQAILQVEYRKRLRKRIVYLFSNCIIIAKKVPRLGHRNQWLIVDHYLSDLVMSQDHLKFDNIKLQSNGIDDPIMLYFPNYNEYSDWYSLLSSQIADQTRSRCPIIVHSNSPQVRRKSITLNQSNSSSSDESLFDIKHKNSPLRVDNRQKILPEHFLEVNENDSETWFNEFQDLYKLPISEDFKIKFLQFAPKQPEKILILRVLHNLREATYLEHSVYLKLRTSVVHSKLFDAPMIASDGPSFWASLTISSYSSIDHNSYSDFIKSICSTLRFPWRTVLTTHSLFQKSCFFLHPTEHMNVITPDLYFNNSSLRSRIEIIAACVLISSKVEETNCSLSDLVEAIEKLIPDLNSNSRNSNNSLNDSLNSKLPAKIIQMEMEILSALSFDVETLHPHYFVRLLQMIIVPSINMMSGESKTIRWRTYSMLDSIQHDLRKVISFQYSNCTIAIGVLYLSWLQCCNSKDENPFLWSELSITPKLASELYDFIEQVVNLLFLNNNEKNLNWLEYFPKIDLSAKIDFGIEDYHLRLSKLRPRGLEAYIPIKTLGEGTFGQVFIARDKITNSLVAIKSLKAKSYRFHMDNGFPYFILREILNMKRLSHPNIVSASEFLVEKDNNDKFNFYIVMEKMDCDLSDLLSYQLTSSISPLWNQSHIKHLLFQLLSGVAFMHSRGIMHRDLKPPNVLFKENGTLKISDLGSLRDITHGSDLRYSITVGTAAYRAPEILAAKGEYSNPVDIWAVGVIFLELLCLNNPFSASNIRDITLKHLQCLGIPDSELLVKFYPDYAKQSIPDDPLIKLENLLENRSEACISFARGLLEYNPSLRLTAEEALDHPYFLEDPLPTAYIVELPNNNSQKKNEVICKALQTHLPEQPGELYIHQGDIIGNVTKESDTWWSGIIQGKRGRFPSNCVSEFEFA